VLISKTSLGEGLNGKGGIDMVSLDLINVGADAVLILVIATSYRMSMVKQAKLEEKIANTLSRSETKDLIEEEIERHLSMMKSDIESIKDMLSQIAEFSLKVKNK